MANMNKFLINFLKVKDVSKLSREEKLTAIDEGCWYYFTRTGNINLYRMSKKAQQLLKENNSEKYIDDEFGLGM